jgi:protein O-mannosyl-transferase
MRQDLLIGLLLAAVTLTLYWPVQSFDFVNFDDRVYVADNQQVHGGLSMESLRWSFTTFHAGNWHPLTWISHMVDFEAYQLNAGGHHWTNVLIHTTSVVLLFLVLSATAGTLWLSALVAGLFAIHPLHVESVAWVAERKDVLSGFFWILTMGAYAYYVKHPTIRRYLLVMLSFVLGLLSKPMVVTLPFVLLLLDYWPLRRFDELKTAFGARVFRTSVSGSKIWLLLVAEKLPFCFIAACACLVTLVAQREVGAIWSLEGMSFEVRIANALVAYMEYIRKMLWPADLAVLYPHIGMPEAWKIGVAVLILVSISYLAVRKAREMPFMLVGWLWYLGTLVPVIGIVQVGSQSIADRYTYMPLVGLFIAISWGMKSIAERQPNWRPAIVVVILLALSGLLVLARTQVESWKNSEALFEQALAVTEFNHGAHHNIGAFYMDHNDCQKAVPHFLKAIQMKNNYAYPYHGLGVCAFREKDPEGALHYFRQALLLDPRFAECRIDRGLLLMQQGRFFEAENDFQEVLRLDPAHEAAHNNMGMLLIQQGKHEEAEARFSDVLRINPRNAEAHNNLGIVRTAQGRKEDAIAHFMHALKLAPENHAVKNNLEQVLIDVAR